MTHPDDQFNDVGLNELRAKLQKAEEGYRRAVLPLLSDLAPESDAELREHASSVVAKAISTYRHEMHSMPKESLKAVRAEIKRKRAALEACLVAVEGGANESLTAHAAFWMAFLQTPGSRRELRNQLSHAISAADRALAGFEGSAYHQGEWHTAGLSARLALSLKELGLRPLATSDLVTRPGRAPKSAGLARLLRVAMEQAGITPPDDLRYVMKKGFELARTRGVPVVRMIEFNGDLVHLQDMEKFDPK